MRTRVLAVVGAAFAIALLPSASAQPAKAATIDFSTAPHSPEPFPKDFYAQQGVVFTEASNVGNIQGDEALGGAPTVAGVFTRADHQALPGGRTRLPRDRGVHVDRVRPSQAGSRQPSRGRDRG